MTITMELWEKDLREKLRRTWLTNDERIFTPQQEDIVMDIFKPYLEELYRVYCN